MVSPIDLFLRTIDSSINIFLYAYFCEAFREKLATLFPWNKVEKNQQIAIDHIERYEELIFKHKSF